MRENNVTVNGGVGFTGLLTIIFITLKLLGVITWSWWLVLSPILVNVAMVLLILVGLVVAAVVKECKK